MQRRQFIQQVALAMGAMRTAGSAKARGSNGILGHGPRRYRLNAGWSKAMPALNPVKDCHEMVMDNGGRLLLLANETRNNVLVYSRSGQVLEAWGTHYPGAHGLTHFDANGEEWLFITDTSRHQVFKTNLQGKVLLTLSYPNQVEAYTQATQFIPTETAIAPNGDIYVADGYGLDFIIQYNAAGQYIRHFGGRGPGPQHLLNAHGICIDLRSPNGPSLLVSSRQQQCFKRFTLQGQYVETISLPGAWVCRPVIKGPYLYTAVLQTHARQGQQSGFVLVLNAQNQVVSSIGGNLPATGQPDEESLYQTLQVFSYPHDVCIDNDDNLYVAQWNSGQVYPYQLIPAA